MAQKPLLRAEVHAHALRASQNVKRPDVWEARDAPDGWTGRGRVREWKALVWGGDVGCAPRSRDLAMVPRAPRGVRGRVHLRLLVGFFMWLVGPLAAKIAIRVASQARNTL
jgi:hypothetical protein